MAECALGGWHAATPSGPSAPAAHEHTDTHGEMGVARGSLRDSSPCREALHPQSPRQAEAQRPSQPWQVFRRDLYYFHSSLGTLPHLKFRKHTHCLMGLGQAPRGRHGSLPPSQRPSVTGDTGGRGCREGSSFDGNCPPAPGPTSAIPFLSSQPATETHRLLLVKPGHAGSPRCSSVLS